MNFSLCSTLNLVFKKRKKQLPVLPFQDYDLVDTLVIFDSDISINNKLKLIINNLKDTNDYIILRKYDQIFIEIGVKNFVSSISKSTCFPIFSKNTLVGCLIIGNYKMDYNENVIKISGDILEVIGNLLLLTFNE